MASHAEPLGQFIIPAEHHDSNHPHYPQDQEHQSGSRRSCISKNCVLIIFSIFFTILGITGIAIWSTAISRNSTNRSSEVSEVSQVSGTYTETVPEVQTVHETTTTFVYTTTRLPLLVKPSHATSTINLSPTSVAPDAPLRPVLAFVTPVVGAQNASTF